MRTCIGLLSATAISMAVLTTPSLADTLADIKSRGTLSVGIKNDYPPYGFLNENGEIVGFEVELAKYVANELLGSPDKIELVPVVASNRIEFLNSGRIDVIFATLGVTDERKKVIDYTVEYVNSPGPSVFARKEAKFTEWEQLRGQSLCGIQGSYFNRHLTDAYGIQLVNFTSQPEAYRALMDNRCVGFVFDDMTLRQALKQSEWADYKIAVETYEYLPIAGGLRKNDAAFSEAVNAAIVKAEGEGKLIEWESEFDMPQSDYLVERAEAARAAAN
ncbi:transporter substrate-binding domain-containing protein [Aureimonas altamirensis]|uniref:transporter substrate-binding domain-containing protein n=1 Tax=Aureimonas altamirensis TaxID=370622 RepID=UPI0030191245